VNTLNKNMTSTPLHKGTFVSNKKNTTEVETDMEDSETKIVNTNKFEDLLTDLMQIVVKLTTTFYPISVLESKLNDIIKLAKYSSKLNPECSDKSFL